MRQNCRKHGRHNFKSAKSTVHMYLECPKRVIATLPVLVFCILGRCVMTSSLCAKPWSADPKYAHPSFNPDVWECVGDKYNYTGPPWFGPPALDPELLGPKFRSDPGRDCSRLTRFQSYMTELHGGDPDGTQCATDAEVVRIGRVPPKRSAAWWNKPRPVQDVTPMTCLYPPPYSRVVPYCIEKEPRNIRNKGNKKKHIHTNTHRVIGAKNSKSSRKAKTSKKNLNNKHGRDTTQIKNENTHTEKQTTNAQQ